MPYKAAKATILERERYFVIAVDKDIRLLVHPNMSRISDEILAQCFSMESAEKIAAAMNQAEGWSVP